MDGVVDWSCASYMAGCACDEVAGQSPIGLCGRVDWSCAPDVVSINREEYDIVCNRSATAH